MSTRSRWLEWEPAEGIISEPPKPELTEPSKRGSVSFGGTVSGQSQNISGPEPEPLAAGSFKGQAVELWRDGNRFFIVADEEDTQETIKRFGARRGEVWTGAEVELVARFGDQAIRDEVARWKRQFDGSLSPDTLSKRARETRTWRGR